MMIPLSLAKLYENPESVAIDFFAQYFKLIERKSSSISSNYHFGHDIFLPFSIWSVHSEVPRSVITVLIAYKPILTEVAPYRFYANSQIRRAGLLIDWDQHIKEALMALNKLLRLIKGKGDDLASRECWEAAALLSNRLELWRGCLYESQEMQLCSYWLDSSLATLVYEQIWAKLLPPKTIFVPRILAIEAQDWIACRHLQNDTTNRCLATINASWRHMQEKEQEAWLLSLKKLLIPLCALEKKETLEIDSIDFDESFDEVEEFLRTICDEETIEDILYRWLIRPSTSKVGLGSFSAIFFYDRCVCKVSEPVPLALPSFSSNPIKYSEYKNKLKKSFEPLFLIERTPLTNLNEYAEDLRIAQKKITTLSVGLGGKAFLSSLIESNINRLESLPLDKLYQFGKELFQQDVRSAYFLIAIWCDSVEAHLESATIKDHCVWHMRYEKAARVIRYFMGKEAVVNKTVFQLDLETVTTNTPFLRALYNGLQWHRYFQYAGKLPPARLPYQYFASLEDVELDRDFMRSDLKSTGDELSDGILLFFRFYSKWSRIKTLEPPPKKTLTMLYQLHVLSHYRWVEIRMNSFFALTQYPPRLSEKVAHRMRSSSRKIASTIKSSPCRLSERVSEQTLEEEDLNQHDLQSALKERSDQEMIQKVLDQINRRSRGIRGYASLAHRRILRWQRPFAALQGAIPCFVNSGILAYADRTEAQQKESWYIHAVAPVILIAQDRALQEKYSTKKPQIGNQERFIFQAELHRHGKRTRGIVELVRDCDTNIYYHAAFNERAEEFLPLGADDMDLPLEGAALVHECDYLPSTLFYNPVGEILGFAVDEHSWYAILPQPRQNNAS